MSLTARSTVRKCLTKWPVVSMSRAESLTKSPAMKMLGGAPARMEELVLADGFKLVEGNVCVRACEMRNAAVCVS